VAKKVIIIGGVAGGASAAARLRRLDEKAEIIMFEKGEHVSYANCGLPYFIGGEITERSALILQTPASFKTRFNVDVRVLSEVVEIDRKAKTVKVKNTKTGEFYRESYDKLILSPGAEPVKPPIDGISAKGVFTLRNIPDTYQIKDYLAHNSCQTAVVVGGGYIGVEMAENLRRAGLAVTLVEMQPQIIAPLDFDMACEIHRYLKSKGVTLLLGNAVEAIRETGSGLDVSLANGQHIKADILILSIGVKPESSLAKNAGLAVTERGAIVVGEDMLTSDPDIYAVGDAVEIIDFVTGHKGLVPLAGPANKQGRLAADNICGAQKSYGGTQGSAILKVFEMTVATTGINEKTAKQLGLDYDKCFTYSGSHASYYPGAADMCVKTIFEKTTGKILGVQIVGFHGTDKRCDVFASAIRFGATAHDLCRLELCYAPPYSSAKDPVNMVGFVIENVLTGQVKNFHWHDVQDLLGKTNLTLLDTRTQKEYTRGHIEGFINIPVDELRSRLHELDPAKPIYVSCQIGLRGYIACRILSQNGFDCYNLSGGYKLYSTVLGEKLF
jgi:NADPH-dependent 2,4-dienoyl-CoA reductase/sulfur reductase-like enzyme/rhodanese-related sulfurtransferase